MFLPDASNNCLPVPTVLDVIKGPSSLSFNNPLQRYHSVSQMKTLELRGHTASKQPELKLKPLNPAFSIRV